MVWAVFGVAGRSTPRQDMVVIQNLSTCCELTRLTQAHFDFLYFRFFRRLRRQTK